MTVFQVELASTDALNKYLGPSAFQLAHLFVLCGVNSLVLFALVLLLIRTLWSLAVNTWTIEGWEIERHHTLLRRARVLGGFLEGPDGVKVRIDHQEFPWDVGIWTNICQGMGSYNPLTWLWPFARSPSVESGLSFPHNEIDGRRTSTLDSDISLITNRSEQTMAATRPRQTLPGTTQDFRRRRLHEALGHGRVPQASRGRHCSLRRC